MRHSILSAMQVDKINGLHLMALLKLPSSSPCVVWAAHYVMSSSGPPEHKPVTHA